MSKKAEYQFQLYIIAALYVSRRRNAFRIERCLSYRLKYFAINHKDFFFKLL